MLPTDAQERKNIPVYSGFICYFPDAIAEVAKVSKRGNEQHNPGKPLHWDRSKSGDELDALARHLLDSTDEAQSLDDKIDEAAARSWRSMADLQKLCEQKRREESGEDLYIIGPQGQLVPWHPATETEKAAHVSALNHGYDGDEHGPVGSY